MDRQWFILERWQEFDAEVRANLIRILAITVFYAVELYNYRVLGGVDAGFHRRATVFAVVWTALALVALLAVGQRFLPWWLKYATTALDIMLLTALLIQARGPQSPLIVVYFLILVLAALRLRLPLISCTTVAVVLSYVSVLAACHSDWFGNVKRDIRVPRHEQLIVVSALIVTGITLGQIVRRVRSLAQEYARRTNETSSTQA